MSDIEKTYIFPLQINIKWSFALASLPSSLPPLEPANSGGLLDVSAAYPLPFSQPHRQDCAAVAHPQRPGPLPLQPGRLHLFSSVECAELAPSLCTSAERLLCRAKS